MAKFKIAHPEDRFTNENNDCTVRALVNAFGVNYRTAHATLKAAGRKDGEGMQFPRFMKSLKDGMLYGQHVKHSISSGMTVKTFVNCFNKGRFIVQHRGHVFAVVNGVIHDSFQVNLKKHVLNYWEISTNPISEIDVEDVPLGSVKIKNQKQFVFDLIAKGYSAQEIFMKAGYSIPMKNIKWYVWAYAKKNESADF